jgi:hypothetical protein
MKVGAGRPTDLDDELLAKIKQCILDGNDLKKTAEISKIPESTLYTWHSKNYLNIADKIEGWRRDRKLMLAEVTSDTIQTLPITDENGKIDKELLKLKQKESEFIRETLGKVNYSKRTELGGIDGKDLTIQVVSYANTKTTKELPAEELPASTT